MLGESFHAEFYAHCTGSAASTLSHIRHAVLRFKLRQNQDHTPACSQDISILDASLSRLAFLRTIVLEAQHISDLSIVKSHLVECRDKILSRSCTDSRQIASNVPFQLTPDVGNALTRISIYWWSLRDTRVSWTDEYNLYVAARALVE